MNTEIKQLLKEVSLSESNKLTLKFLIDSIEKNEIHEFNDKTFLFSGPPGIGKTYFLENLLRNIDLPILFVGPFKFEHKNVKKFNSLRKLFDSLVDIGECIVFIDDLQNAISLERDGIGDVHLSDSEGKVFIGILEHIRRSKARKYFFMTLNDEYILEESWLDRIETRIELEEPKEKSKSSYLSKRYSKYLSKRIIEEISVKTIGYNFRDLDELIRMAYREGNHKITVKSTKKSLTSYAPTATSQYNIIHKTDIKLKDVLGNEKLKNELSYLKKYVNYPKFFEKSELNRSNVLLFAGPPGTGKTFMAKAIAGELEMPIINIDAQDIHLPRGGGLASMKRIANLARKFRNCIIFVDELDKHIGGQLLSEEDTIIGSLEAELDGIRKKTQAIVIFTINNKARFGSAFHDRMPCFNFNYPTANERRLFLENKIKKVEIPINQDQINRIINISENLSYRQIEKIWNNIIFKIMDKEGTIIKNNKLFTKEENIEETISDILGIVGSVRPFIGIG